MIPVLCATKGGRRPYGLHLIPDYEYRFETEGRWCQAANRLLGSAVGGPAWFVDDDIEFVVRMNNQYPFDITGFNLYAATPAGLQLVSCGFNLDLNHEQQTATMVPERDPWIIGNTAEHAHVTASCLWLSERAVERLRFVEWKGDHHEDVVFTLQAWLDGLTVGRVPEPVIHHMNVAAGVGATKSQDPAFNARRVANWQALQCWMADQDIYARCMDGTIPYQSILYRDAVTA